MLIQYNFKNFKSYRDEVCLDLRATQIKEHEYNLIEGKRGERYLKVASIHGSNASGKSNVIESFHFMRRFVLNSFADESKKNKIDIKQFVLCPDHRKEKSKFEVYFINEDKEYRYGFELDSEMIHEEWLYKRDYRTRSRYNVLFDRDLKGIKVGSQLKEVEKFKSYIEKRTLFLSFLSNIKIKEVKSIFDWFTNTQVVNFGDALMETIMTMAVPYEEMKKQKYKNKFLKFLHAVDIGIINIEVEKVLNLKKGEEEEYELYSYHKAKGCDQFIKLPFEEESSGTQKIAAIYHLVMGVLKSGNTLFIDELDAKLHPLMLRYIINLFHNEETNRYGSQLIFTSQNTFILNKDLFRRDQIWFVDKDQYGVSNLESLVDKRVRKDASFAKDYLLGKYGASPKLKEFNIEE